LKELNERKMELFASGYYNDSPSLFPDNLFKKLYDSDMFDAVVKKYQSFEGVGGSKVTNETLLCYLRQYLYLACSKSEIELLLDGVLMLLLNATFLERELIVHNISSFLKKMLEKNYKKYCAVPLGGFRDSAKHIGYYLNDVNKEIINQFSLNDTVTDALKLADSSDSCISFYDDGAYSGKQVISIFQELMGVPKDYRTTKESHIKELDADSKEKLKASNIILAYICFKPATEKYILDELGKLGICNVKILHELDLSQKVFDPEAKIFKSTEQMDIVKKYLHTIGYQVLKSTKINEDGTPKERWNEDRFFQESLGYNDAQQIIVYDYNIPTFSLTPLWQNGKFNGYEWRGLFQRTDKD
jgi:hypothetical protein